MWSFPTALYNRPQQNPEIKVTANSLVDKVVAAAKAIVGQRETPGNSGFVDKVFEQRMKDTGWNKGESWCIYTTELIWKTAFGTEHPLYAEIDKLFSGSAIRTWENFCKSVHFHTGNKPKPGAIVIFRHGRGWQGHGGIVITPIITPDFPTVEGNTNSKGGREGIEVAPKFRKTGQDFKPNDLNLEGFIYLPE